MNSGVMSQGEISWQSVFGVKGLIASFCLNDEDAFGHFHPLPVPFRGFYPVLNRNQKFEEDDNRYVTMQYINIATSNVKGIVLTLFLNRIFINDSFHFFLFLSLVILNIAVSHMHLTFLLWLWGSCHISGFLARKWTNSMVDENYSLFFFCCVFFSLSSVQCYLVHYTFLKSFFSSNSHVLSKKAGNLGAKTRADTTLLHSVVREKEKKSKGSVYSVL